MINRTFPAFSRAASLIWALLCLSLYSGAALSQQAQPPEQVDELIQQAPVDAEEAASVDEDTLIEEVIVTGSRIRRNEFTSISPVQIISGQRSREVGLIDTASMLQSNPTATGAQIDNTYTAFVLDNGPGATNINLRGLDASRTLLLVNSRRMAPSGIGGAPTAADLNSIPSIMIDRVELLLDGASSVYGSDAVAGVVNVLMRQQFDGLEFEADYAQPGVGAGEEAILSLAYGRDFDRGSFGLGAEYYDRSRLRFSDRGHTSECDKFLEIDFYGVTRSDDLSLVPGTTINGCKLSTINRVFIRGHQFGNVWYTPGETNIGIPNFSETGGPPWWANFNPTVTPVDTDGDGEPDLGIVDPDRNGLTEVDLKNSLYNFNGSETDRAGDYVPGLQRFSVYSFGNYELQDANNTSLFFELMYNHQKLGIYSPGAAIFPDVPGSNPYNPCNQNAPGGVNCWGFFGPFNFGNQVSTPIIVVRGDRDQVDVNQDQIRLLGGVEGDLPWGTTWSYEGYVSYSWSKGKSRRDGILEAELQLSLNTAAIDPASGNVVCGLDGNEDGLPDGQGCVPVNLFAGSLYQPGGGDFATQAERDYLFGSRRFKTVVEQTIVGATIQGDIARLPWNDIEIPLVLGVEYRKDVVDSQPNDVARDGLLFGFFSDRGAKGSRNLKEAYAETELRLLEGQPLADELVLNLSGRWTDESTYGSHFTFSTKMKFSPVEEVDFRGSYGTSFRAPNAREQFLAGQSGFLSLFDPCVVPTEARTSAAPGEPLGYDPSMDDRSQTILDNCRAQGVDPTMLGLAEDTVVQYSVEIFDAGGEVVQSTIDPEESTAWTAGIVLRQPWFDNFDLSLSATYYDIEVEDSIAQFNPQFFVNDCFIEKANASSPFCRFVNRDADSFIDFIDSSYFNIAKETSAGWDWNLLFETEWIIADRNLELAVDVQATRVNQQFFVFEDITEDSAGSTVVPEWEGILGVQIEYDDFRLNWRAAYIKGGEEEAEEFDENDTCIGIAQGCRPVYFTKDSWVHTASLTWQPDDWRVTLGVRNIFNEKPHLMDGSAPRTQLNNVPLGVYGVNHHVGRTVFAGVSRSFGLNTRGGRRS